jgi:orotidine-5'-phosphate decarboxylase
MTSNPIYCAIDTLDIPKAAELARAVAPHVGGLKLGMEFFYRNGAFGYAALAEIGLPIFLDLKLHDIPNTVAQGLTALMHLRPAIVNVHIAGGREMMLAARKAIDAADTKTRLIGVSVLTSLNTSDLSDIGVERSTQDQVIALARLAQSCGLDGIVCSAHEITAIRDHLGADFNLIVPGIRPTGSAVADQKRVMTPAQAMAAGADILVIGRPITEQQDPAAAAAAIAAELGL